MSRSFARRLRSASRARPLMHAALGVVLAVALAAGACKARVPERAKPASAVIDVPPLADRIIGTWATACMPNEPGGATIIEAVITRDPEGPAGDLLYELNEFSDPGCTRQRGKVSMAATYAVVPASVRDGGTASPSRLDVLTQPKSMVVKPLSSAEQERLASRRYCGSEMWKAGEEMNVSLTDCGDLLLDTSKAGQLLSISVMPDDSIVIAGAGVRMARRPPPAKITPSLRVPPSFDLQAQDHKGSFAPCTDNPGEACGDFTADMRLACEYCKGGIDTCKFKRRWRLDFATAIATQLDTRPPGGVCSPSKTDLLRDPLESHDDVRSELEGKVAAPQNAGSGVKEDPSSGQRRTSAAPGNPAPARSAPVNPAARNPAPANSAPANAPSQARSARAGASGALSGSAMARQEKVKQRKELVANAVGFAAGWLPTGGAAAASLLCGPGAPGCFAASLATMGVSVGTGLAATHLSGQFLDRLFPTPEVDKARRREQQRK